MLTLIRCWVGYRAQLAVSVYRVTSRFEPEYAVLSEQIVRTAGKKHVFTLREPGSSINRGLWNRTCTLRAHDAVTPTDRQYPHGALRADCLLRPARRAAADRAAAPGFAVDI